MAVRIIDGDCLTSLAALPAGIAQTCVTSPPYYGLRDYGVDGQIGLEPTPAEYVARLVAVFREVRRVLRDDGTAWLNLGDSYSATQANNGGCSPRSTLGGGGGKYREGSKNAAQYEAGPGRRRSDGVKHKDLLGIPWEVAFALRADGWFLRSAIVWAKPNPMPESVRDRPTSAYEMVFLLSKRAAYYYDAEAIAEDALGTGGGEIATPDKAARAGITNNGTGETTLRCKGAATRNARNVWTIATQPYSGAHFATMPPDLAERCIKAGSSERGQCPHCGSPWGRVVERVAAAPARSGDWKATGGEHRNDIDRKGGFYDSRSETTGWAPSCACPPHQPVPQVVIDPFGGAGTTALVADRLQRDVILCELNPEYARLARLRLLDDAPLLSRIDDEETRKRLIAAAVAV